MPSTAAKRRITADNYLDARLVNNQVYIEDADSVEVYNFIAARCVNAKGRGR